MAKELGYEITELNASDTRSKKQLDSVVADALGTRWVTNTSAKKLLLMDEVDGMAGNEDRGGVGELIQVSHAINRESVVSSTSESGFS